MLASGRRSIALRSAGTDRGWARFREIEYTCFPLAQGHGRCNYYSDYTTSLPPTFSHVHRKWEE